MGERSAVRPKSGQSVSQSDPGLRRPTSPSTVGRKSAARPPIQLQSPTDSKLHPKPREAGVPQPKTGRGAGWNPAQQPRREAPGSFSEPVESEPVLPYDVDDSQIKALIEFFETLDRWDREAHEPKIM